MRLAKYLAHGGIASRRAAERLVAAGRVTVAGAVVTDPARDVDESSDVRVDAEPVRPVATRLVYALHKPPGVVSTARDPGGRPTVVDLVASDERLYPIGRLDADASGLILLTNDGALANRLTHPRYEVPKVYRVQVRRPPVREAALRALREGVELDDGRTAPAEVRRLAPDALELTLREGRKRQVKRMCQAVGHPVERLVRVAFGPLALGELPPGAFRRLDPHEVEALRRAADPPRRPAGPAPAAAPAPRGVGDRARRAPPRPRRK